MAVANLATYLIVDGVELIPDEGHKQPHFRMQVIEYHLENRTQKLRVFALVDQGFLNELLYFVLEVFHAVWLELIEVAKFDGVG
jgi:hypothetical protein